jgi:beta-glucosidase-like glycosyl hydrolase
MSVANLLVPAIRWDAVRGYDRAAIERALSLQVGGVVLIGGEQDAVRALTKELRLRSRVPLLIAAELERGAGQQFGGATGLPPLAAIASLNDPELVRRAARLTAREARTMGVNWDLAPVVDLDLAHDNPTLGTRTFGSDAHRVAELSTAWIRSCQGEGVLACAKHFPGRGRLRVDAASTPPTIDESKRELLETDLMPFRAAIDAGVATMMAANVAYPALDASGAPAVCSREILQWFLRQQLRFDGLIVADATSLASAGDTQGVEDPVVAAINAGCDVMLCVDDVEGMIERLERAVARHELREESVQQSLRRRLKWAQWASPPNEWRKPSAADVAWGAQLADRVVRMVRGVRPPLRAPLDVMVLSSEPGAPSTAAGEPFMAALRSAGWEARRVDAPSGEAGSGRSTVVLVLGETVATEPQRAGYGPAVREAVERACVAAPGVLVMQFGHPRLIRDLSGAPAIATAWSSDPVMQQAAARWIVGQGSRAF